MPDIVAIHGSPRRNGNTSTLLRHAVEGARESGAEVEEFILRNLTISPCLELYGCKSSGECIIKDDFQIISKKILESKGLMIASPIFFYAVSAHTKTFMDRSQSLWVKKHWIDKVPYGDRKPERKGLFISVGATKGKKLFDGALLSIRYFFEVFDIELWKSLLYRNLDFEEDVLAHPDYLSEAYETGKNFADVLDQKNA